MSAKHNEKLEALYAQDANSADSDLQHTAYQWAKTECRKGIEPSPAAVAEKYHELTGRRLFTADTKVLDDGN